MIHFKVRMGLHGRVKWRELQLSEQSTLHDLALRILNSYQDQSDNDFHPDDPTHLYGFWLKGKPWDSDALVYWHPEADGLPKANRIELSTLNLSPGQKFLFLFDFGAEWPFVVKVMNREEKRD